MAILTYFGKWELLSYVFMQVSSNRELLPKLHLLSILKKNLYLASKLTAVIYHMIVWWMKK